MPRPRTICYTFPERKYKALTLSFDDNHVEDRRLVAMLNRYGIKATFNLISGGQGDDRIPQNEFAGLYKGHEAASHTVSHPTLTCCSPEQAALQILEDRRTLERLTGAPVRGLAYPNGIYDRRIMDMLPALGIRYARTVHDTGGFLMPQDFYAWDPSCHFRRGVLELADQFAALNKPNRLQLFYVWGHSFELSSENDWQLMEIFCQKMCRHADIWYATNIEIVDYMDRLSRLQFTADADKVYNPSALPCWTVVDNKLYEIPGGETIELR